MKEINELMYSVRNYNKQEAEEAENSQRKT